MNNFLYLFSSGFTVAYRIPWAFVEGLVGRTHWATRYYHKNLTYSKSWLGPNSVYKLPPSPYPRPVGGKHQTSYLGSLSRSSWRRCPGAEGGRPARSLATTPGCWATWRRRSSCAAGRRRPPRRRSRPPRRPRTASPAAVCAAAAGTCWTARRSGCERSSSGWRAPPWTARTSCNSTDSPS